MKSVSAWAAGGRRGRKIYGSSCKEGSVLGNEKCLVRNREELGRMDADVKAVARSIIQGNEKRKRRIRTGNASRFDAAAVAAVETALRSSCMDIDGIQPRRQMQEKIYKSIVNNIPYEYIADALCGRRQFYGYRTEFITRVAQAMDMLPGGKGENGNERD